MYRPDLNSRDRGGAIAAVIAVHAALLLALLQISGRVDLADPQSAMRLIDVIELEPPPEPPPPPPSPQQRQKAKPKAKEGGSPANIRSQATAVVAPRPRVQPQRPNPVVVTETPRQGAAPTQGAAAISGPGTGAGGSGTGSGTGSGSGPGGGGDGGVAVPVSLVRGITGQDYPPAIRRSWPRGAAIFLRLRIEPNGRPSQCDVMRGFGDRLADQWTCSLVMQRALFRPARDSRGNPVSAWFGYKQVDIGR